MKATLPEDKLRAELIRQHDQTMRTVVQEGGLVCYVNATPLNSSGLREALDKGYLFGLTIFSLN